MGWDLRFFHPKPPGDCKEEEAELGLPPHSWGGTRAVQESAAFPAFSLIFIFKFSRSFPGKSCLFPAVLAAQLQVKGAAWTEEGSAAFLTHGDR